MKRTEPAVVGIDVGGVAKGFHAVALRGGSLLGRFASTDAAAICRWTTEQEAAAVGVDAPCRWRAGAARAAERALAAEGLRVFATPSASTARATPFHHWMLNGALLYRALARAFPLFDGRPGARAVAFETFPHAVACVLAGRRLCASRKRSDRRAVLERTGMDTALLPGIDDVDAALCALAARYLVLGQYRALGERRSGLIVLPTPQETA